MRHRIVLALAIAAVAVLHSPASSQPDSAEITYWESVRDSKTPAELEAYLKAYPDGAFAPLARIRLKALQEGQQKSAAPAPSKDDATGAPATNGAESTASEDAAQANRRLRKAAEGGDADAMNSLAVNLEKGNGITRDIAEANRWLRKAAEAGSEHAMYNLARKLQDGDGITQDVAEANRWLRKAAEAGITQAMVWFGFNLQEGNGITKDATEANRWYRKAADAGSQHGMYVLAYNLQRGDGIPKDEAEALRWFRASAGKGDPEAMYQVGLAYETGRGVTKDSIQAAEWYFKAIRAGNDYAVKVMREKSAAFSHEFRRELQRRLHEAGHYDGAADGDFGSSTLRAIEALHATAKKPSQSAAASQPVAPAASPPPDLGNVKDLDTLE